MSTFSDLLRLASDIDSLDRTAAHAKIVKLPWKDSWSDLPKVSSQELERAGFRTSYSGAQLQLAEELADNPGDAEDAAMGMVKAYQKKDPLGNMGSVVGVVEWYHKNSDPMYSGVYSLYHSNA